MMTDRESPRRPRVAAGLVPVDLDADDPRAELEARQDAALQQALDKMRDKAEGAPHEVVRIHLGDPFELRGKHYIGVAIAFSVGESPDNGTEQNSPRSEWTPSATRLHVHSL